MKKLILTSATVLFLGLGAYAQDGGKCAKKGAKKCDQTECAKKCDKKCGMDDCTAGMKCKDDKSCTKSCKMEGEKKSCHTAEGK